MRLISICLIVLGLALGGTLPGAGFQEEEGSAEVGKPRIEMKPFNLALLDRGRVTGKATLHLVLVIEKSGAHEFVRTRLPQVRADFNSALTVLARQRFSVSKPIDPDVVRAYLSPYADYRLGAGVVSVYVHQALIDPS